MAKPRNVKNNGLENAWNILKSALLWLVAISFLAILVMISAQETFKDILIPLGLYHDRTGALVDCSDPDNQKSRYCGGDKLRKPHSLRDDPRDGIGFSLSD